jgi:tripartite-type tricarboxylate transporter receptor subunit TctC
MARFLLLGWAQRAALALACACLAGHALAQAFPSKPITVVMPIPASTAYYVLMRQMADQIQQRAGRAIVLDLAIGGNGTLAPAKVRRAPPDGYAIGLTWAAPLTLNPLLTAAPAYDPLKDFTPITMLTRHGILFAAGAQFAPRDLRELIALARDKPGAVKVGQSATGSIVGIHELEQQGGVHFLLVPYKSSAQSEVAALTGEIDVVATTAGSALGQIKAGKMKGLFIGSRNRTAILPDVPSVSEVYPDVEIVSWYALYGPAGMPADVVEWHHREWTAELKDPKIAERMRMLGFDVVAGAPAELAEQIRREMPANAQIVKQYNITE